MAGECSFSPLAIPLGVSCAGVRAGRAGRPVAMERTMLSPHEFATLLLVKDAPDQTNMDRDEIDALLEQQLVRLEGLGSGRKYCVTESGDAALRSIKYRYS
ncbi:hypothetical protein FEQ05_02667 [Burkholderia pseudomultivorans]|uniref:Preprotein translocase SecA n=2 Tax=Burkholderia pseudomultivorans TaxID=1207504 RepID=A0ABU2E4N2_9BURK|nr:hypothetical protein [Burkholderia pseudomultivorans]MDR8733159.1 hypothetical protein [Burkholderia pseudomultivorans]MDR8742896.1 hypothetical protein [Burkholderia pseudomultivorans]MDR8754664.1 hypothetical protein [Burkholderia pseudomultivorans]MDR8776132.1 hypothetical protein [Burkholderia pseudomultivorans]